MEAKDLQPASFRNVRFLVDSSERKGGRRAVVHEYPQRDESYVEDLGRKARTFSVRAYFVGADAKEQSEAFLAACEEKGPARLELPWRTSLMAVCTEFSEGVSLKEWRFVAVDLTFVQAGEAQFPMPSQATPEKVVEKSRSAVDAAREAFDKVYSLAKLASWALEAAETQKNKIIGLVSGTRKVVANAARFTRRVSQLLDASGAEFAALDLAQEVEGLVSDLGDVRLRDSDLARRRLEEMLGLVEDSPENGSEPAAPAAKQSARNVNAQNDLLRALAAAEAARSSADVTPESDADAARLRELVLAVIDQVLDTTEDDDLFAALSDLRAAVARDLSARGRLAPRLRSVTLQQSVPALVLAWREQESLEAEADIIARNGIAHPGFLPAGAALEVLGG
ncbi:DNA circularization protein [Desulfocurvibacter africanus]|uniref:DNA circularization protein n=1 Tax=Desulfocurvibacter africanus TaxID=873 RepID=UPI00040977EA|nr:DNA circularization N-terminal domain-containing protein [Desulfocurvibacter africanus]